MRLAKTVGRVGFVFGFLGPLLFYSSPYQFLYGSHIVCPVCPYVEIPVATKMMWIGVGLRLGLFCGLAYALIGFGIVWSIFKFRVALAKLRIDG